MIEIKVLVITLFCLFLPLHDLYVKSSNSGELITFLIANRYVEVFTGGAEPRSEPWTALQLPRHY
jgi:hypothetical protein